MPGDVISNDRFDRQYRMFLKGIDRFCKLDLPLDEIPLKNFARSWVIPDPEIVEVLHDKWNHGELKIISPFALTPNCVRLHYGRNHGEQPQP